MRALIVDDERNIRTTLSMYLEQLGWQVSAAASGEEALKALASEVHEVCFLDLRLGEESGLDVLPRLLSASPGLAVIVVTAYATVDTAVEAMKRGATDYLPKPFTPAHVRHLVDQVEARRRVERRVADLERQLAEMSTDATQTDSPRMRVALDLVARAAASDAPVLLRGESGTGKGVAARMLHAGGRRSAGPFAVVNCPTLTEELLASELFGHVRGAFTGAVKDQPGRVEAAEGGTLFLDEIAEISPGLQAKLLRFLQEKQFERVGETRTRTADVRVVAATNRDLEADVAAGRFRQDLLYRLNVLEIELPPLRERREDILPLARGFLAMFARGAARRVPVLTAEAEALLLAHPWPGNVRELRNAMERAVILWPSDRIEPAALSAPIRAASPAGPEVGGDVSLEAIERAHIERVLARTATQEEAAQVLGIDASTLWRKRKKYEES